MIFPYTPDLLLFTPDLLTRSLDYVRVVVEKSAFVDVRVEFGLRLHVHGLVEILFLRGHFVCTLFNYN